MLLEELPPDLPLLLVAVADVGGAELDEELRGLFPAGSRFELGAPGAPQRAGMFEVRRWGGGRGDCWLIVWMLAFPDFGVNELCIIQHSCQVTQMTDHRKHLPPPSQPPMTHRAYAQPLMLAAAQPPARAARAVPQTPPPALPKAPEAVAAAEEGRAREAAAAARAAWEGEQQVLRLLRMALRDVTVRLLQSRK